MLVDPLGQVVDLRLDMSHPSVSHHPMDPPLNHHGRTFPSIEAQASPVVLCFATSFQVKDFFSAVDGITSGGGGCGGSD